MMSNSFNHAFNHAMLFEVGPGFDPYDHDTSVGNIATPLQKRKVGYVNHANDRGGVTKYGIAQNSHPDISVEHINLIDAREIYEKEYWSPGKCQFMPAGVAIVHFDGCVNHGVGRANKLLQEALNVTIDGLIGKNTLGAISRANQIELIDKMCDVREMFYKRIVTKDVTQKVFLNGWLLRIDTVRRYAKRMI